MKRAHKTKVRELINNLTPLLKATCERLYNSGALDVEAYNPEEFVLAKILVTAAMEQHASDYHPLDDTHKQDLHNLRHF